MEFPERTHIYQNHHLDSTRWDRYVTRTDDIVIATPYKSGTTWMQHIIHSLLYPENRDPFPSGISPWLDIRVPNLDELIDNLEAQTHRRFIKTHLPLDGLTFYENVKYIVVSRDVRDVFMSLWNHYSSYAPRAYDSFNNTPGRMGEPQPHCPDDISDFWKMWISRGWFEWETEGYPFWSNMRHVQTWWNYKDLPNILFVHYNNLKQDTESEIRRIAEYLEIEIPKGSMQNILTRVSLDTMRQNAIDKERDDDEEPFMKGGARSFFYKGTNNRWRNVLTAEDLLLYEEAVARELSADCHQWLERG